MKKRNKYTELGLKAITRAAEKVAENARRNNCKIPIWKDGHTEYVAPNKITEQITSLDFYLAPTAQGKNP